RRRSSRREARWVRPLAPARPGLSLCLARQRSDESARRATAKARLRDESGKLIPIDVKVGDRVLFGKWSGTEVKLDGIAQLVVSDPKNPIPLARSSADVSPPYGFMLLPGTTSSGFAMKRSSFSLSHTKSAPFMALE